MPLISSTSLKLHDNNIIDIDTYLGRIFITINKQKFTLDEFDIKSLLQIFYTSLSKSQKKNIFKILGDLK